MTQLSPLDEARDPQTSAARLAELAANHTETHVAIVTHPAVYSGLLDWLAEHGDDEVRAAIATRTASRATPPPPPPASDHPPVEETTTLAPPTGRAETPTAAVVPESVAAPAAAAAPALGGAPGVTPAVASEAAPVAPGQAGPARRFSPTKILIAAGAFVVVVILVVVGAIAVPALLSRLNSDPKQVTTPDFATEPNLGVWESNHPLTSVGIRFQTTNIVEHTVGQDRSLVVWSLNAIDGTEDGSEVLSFLDTRTGEDLWHREFEVATSVVTSSQQRGRAVVENSTNDDYSWTVYDLRDGSALASVEVGDYDSRLRLVSALDSLDGDIIAVSSDTIGRYDLDTLDAVWTADYAGEDVYAQVGSVIVGSDVFDARDGSLRPWKVEQPDFWVDFAGNLITVRNEGSSLTLGSVDEATGEEIWSELLPSDGLVPVEDDGLLVFDDDAGSVSLRDWKDGREVWTIENSSNLYPSSLGSTLQSRVALLPTSDDADHVVGMDVATGEQLFDVSAQLTSGYPQYQIAATAKTLYWAGGNPTELIALDARKGTVRWSLEAPFADRYTFAEWGGNLVAFHTIIGNGTEEYPNVLGVG